MLTKSRTSLVEIVVAVGTVLLAAVLRADDVVLHEFDFRQVDVIQKWRPLHDVSKIEASPEGMTVRITGSDPYLAGPASDFPNDVPLLMRMRLRSEASGTAQLFFYDVNTTEEQSVRFQVPAGEWYEALVPLPALGPKFYFRIDPPGDHGTCVIERMWFERRLVVAAPQWPKPTMPQITNSDLVVSSGDVRVRHRANKWGEFAVQVGEHTVAVGNNRPLIGYRIGSEVRWLDVPELARMTTARQDGAIVVTATLKDGDGVTWTLRQRFEADGSQTDEEKRNSSQAIQVETELSSDTNRLLVFAPLLILHAGVGTHGERKSQGLFAGVEYLEDEPSSSTADIEGPAALRRVPDATKITFPLMAISAADKYVGLVWEQQPQVAALFDSPDRVFASSGHVLGLIAPASDGRQRKDGELFPFEPALLAANQPLTSRATIIAGSGKTIVSAIQHDQRLRKLPPVRLPMSQQEYVTLTAAGWLDTPLRDGAKFAHAIGGTGFDTHPAGDASWMLRWLGETTADSSLSKRLLTTSAEAAALVPAAQEFHSRVGHLHIPVLPLMTGHVAEVLPHVRQHGFNLLSRFEKDGVVRYQPAPNRPDFSRTHSSREANGLHAQVVVELLQAAMFSGDRKLIDESLVALRQLNRYDNGVPRGAQTWEIPLHTPDIMASAHLTKAYWLGHQLTGDSTFRERAEYWAWTGVPFIDLAPPNKQQVGPYATIAVLGATHWVAPVWIGLPVQWCGLVYADAIKPLGGEWSKLSDGIVASAMQQLYPLDHPHRGLLPDSFTLQTQTRNPADINPGTLQPLAMWLLSGVPSYQVHVSRLNDARLIIHAPGLLDDFHFAGPERFRCRVTPWSQQEYSILVHGIPKSPTLKLNGQETKLAEPNRYLPETGSLILRLRGTTTVEWN